MSVHSEGAIKVSVPGVPVQATSNEAIPSLRVSCHSILFEALPGNVGKIYIGLKSMNKSTFLGVLGWIAPPTTNISPSFTVTEAGIPAGFNLADFYVDADNANDGALISYIRI